jgi:nucleoid-associated protein YgaU
VTLAFPPKDVLQGRASLGDGTAPAAAPSSTTPRTTVPGPTIAGQARPSTTTGKSYTFQKGDVLSTVAQKTLGSARRWQELVDANPGVLDDPDNVAVGTVIKIPTSSAMR